MGTLGPSKDIPIDSSGQDFFKTFLVKFLFHNLSLFVLEKIFNLVSFVTLLLTSIDSCRRGTFCLFKPPPNMF